MSKKQGGKFKGGYSSHIWRAQLKHNKMLSRNLERLRKQMRISRSDLTERALQVFAENHCADSVGVK